MWQLLLQLQPVIQQRAVPKAFLMARGLTARLRQCSLAHAVRLAVLGLALILSAGTRVQRGPHAGSFLRVVMLALVVRCGRL